jgi:hypothetical protein
MTTQFDKTIKHLLEQGIIDMSIFDVEDASGSNDPVQSGAWLPAGVRLPATQAPYKDIKKQYTELTRENTLGFWLWTAIQAIDVTQVTSIMDVTIAVEEFATEKTPTTAAVLCLELVFLVLGSIPGLEFLKNTFRESLKSPQAIKNFFVKEILPRKQLIFDALAEMPKGLAIIPVAKEAFSVLEAEDKA